MADEETTTTTTSPEGQGEVASMESLLAAEGTQTEAKEETQVETKTEETHTESEPPQKKSDENHPTVLGRKVKELTESFAASQARIEALLSKIDLLTSQRTPEQPQPSSGSLYDRMCAIEKPPIEFATTPEEHIQMDEWKTRVQGKLVEMHRKSYVQSYLGQMSALKEEGGDLHDRIIAEITRDGSPYNVKREKNWQGARGDIDAELNYHKAHKALLMGKTDGKAGNFAKQSPEGSGVTIPQTRNTSTTTSAKKLSPEAQAYADWAKMKPEDIADAMSRPVKTHGARL